MSNLAQLVSPHTFIDMHYTKDTLDMSFHRHESLEICYIASGAMNMSYRTGDSEPLKNIAVYENQFIVIRPGILHSQTTQDAHMLVLELWPTNPAKPVNVQIANSEFFSLMPSGKNFFLNLEPLTILTDAHEVKPRLKRLLHLLYDVQHGNATEFYTAEYDVYLGHVFLEICKCAASTTVRRYNRYIQYVLSFVQNNYGQQITVKKLAENLSLSPVYLNSFFKKEIGTNIQDYIIDVRIRNAIKLLFEQNYTVTAIARKVGYRNLRAFEIAFIKKTGFSPTEYCRRNNPTSFVLWKHHDTEFVGEDLAVYAVNTMDKTNES